MRDAIVADRLRLRPLALADAPAITAYANDPGVNRMVRSLPPRQPTCGFEGWIMILAARAPLGEDFVYAIEAEGELAGVIGAHVRGGCVEIGYWLGRPFWGHGYATEALKALIPHARALGPLHAAHFADNPASGRVLEKAGFVYTGAVERQFCLARGERVDTRLMQHEAQRMAA
jgi:RimJ/RimL family protein N-acetyltransferase